MLYFLRISKLFTPAVLLHFQLSIMALFDPEKRGSKGPIFAFFDHRILILFKHLSYTKSDRKSY